MTPRTQPPRTDAADLDRADFRTPAAFRAARASHWANMIESGLTLQEIGDRAGISRERVRQVLAKEGFHERRGYRPRVDPKRVTAALRDGRCRNIRGVARLAACTVDDATRVLKELGLWETATRRFKARTVEPEHGGEQYSRAGLVRAMQAFHAQYGYPPAIGDALAGLLPFGKTTVLRRFGTWNKAVIAAGFSPNRFTGAQRRSKR